MLRLHPEQLAGHLNTELRSAYLLLGSDIFLTQESQKLIRQSAMTYGFKEHYIFQFENNTIDWQKIFSLCLEKSLFSEHKILQIILTENNSKIIDEKMLTLVNLLHNDLLLIIQMNKLSKEKKKASWFKELTSRLVLITCQTPEREDLFRWVFARAKSKQLQLEVNACQFLCYYYEGNLLALAQELDQLKLLWPDGNLTLTRVEQTVKNNAAYFTPFHWVDSLLEAKYKRALRILQQFRLHGSEPAILLRILQRELILLLNLKRQFKHHQSLCALFDKFHIWKHRHTITIKALNRLSQDQIRQAIHLLARTEIFFKKNQSQSVWLELDNLSLFLCHKPLSNIFTDN